MRRRYRAWRAATGAVLPAIIVLGTAAHAQEAADRFRTPAPKVAPSVETSKQTDGEVQNEADSNPADEDLPRIQFGQFEKLGDGSCRGQKTLNTMLRERGALKGCIASRLDPSRDSDLKGRLELQWSVASDGNVTWASVERSTLDRPQLERCLVETIEVTEFDGPKGGNCRFQYVVEVGDPGMPGVVSDEADNLDVGGSGGMGERMESDDEVGFGTETETGDVESDARSDEEVTGEESEPTPDQRAATLDLRLLSTDGCPGSSIAHSVGGRERALRYCYERELADAPQLAGVVIVEWTIGSDGSVQSVEISESTLDDSSVAACTRRIVQRLRHEPLDGGSCRVEYRMEFAPKRSED